MNELSQIDINVYKNVEHIDLTTLDPQVLAKTINFGYKYEINSYDSLLLRSIGLIRSLTKVDFIQYLIQPILNELSKGLSPGLVDAFRRNPMGNLNKEDIQPQDIFASPNIFFKYLGLFTDDELNTSEKIGISGTYFKGESTYLSETLKSISDSYEEAGDLRARSSFANGYLNKYERTIPEVSLELAQYVGMSRRYQLKHFYGPMVKQDLKEWVMSYIGEEDFDLNIVLRELIDKNSPNTLIAIISSGKYPRIETHVYEAFKNYPGNNLDTLFRLALSGLIDAVLLFEHFKNKHQVNYSIDIKGTEDIVKFVELERKYLSVPLTLSAFINPYKYSIHIKDVNLFDNIYQTFKVLNKSVYNIFEGYEKDPIGYLPFMDYLIVKHMEFLDYSFTQIIKDICSGDLLLKKIEGSRYLSVDFLMDKGFKITSQHISIMIRSSCLDLFIQVKPTIANFPIYGVTEIVLTQTDKIIEFLKNIPKETKISTYHLMAVGKVAKLHESKFDKANIASDILELSTKLHMISSEYVSNIIQSRNLQAVKDLFNVEAYNFTEQDVLVALTVQDYEIINYILYKINNYMKSDICKNLVELYIPGFKLNFNVDDIYTEIYKQGYYVSNNIHSDFNRLNSKYP